MLVFGLIYFDLIKVLLTSTLDLEKIGSKIFCDRRCLFKSFLQCNSHHINGCAYTVDLKNIYTLSFFVKPMLRAKNISCKHSAICCNLEEYYSVAGNQLSEICQGACCKGNCSWVNCRM